MKTMTYSPALNQQESEFLQVIKKELSLPSASVAVQVVTPILQALRQSLSLSKASALLNQLPDFLKLVFVANWRQREQQVPIQHLDELVTLVIAYDQRRRKKIFKSEVQALTAVVLTLKKLYKIVDLDRFDGLSPILRQELRRIPAEAA